MTDIDYRMYAVRVFVRDFDTALDFYTRVLGMTPGFTSAEVGWAEFETGGARLALERISDDAGAAMARRFVGVSFAVDDIHAVHAELVSRGVEFDSAPEAQPWGGTLAHFRDPEGNVLTLLG